MIRLVVGLDIRRRIGATVPQAAVLGNEKTTAIMTKTSNRFPISLHSSEMEQSTLLMDPTNVSVRQLRDDYHIKILIPFCPEER